MAEARKALGSGALERGRRLVQMLLPGLAPADVQETASQVRVRLTMPGHDPQDIRVRVQDHVLTIKSERRPGPTDGRGRAFQRIEQRLRRFSRSITLPGDVDVARAEARYDSGMLTVTLPRHEQPRAPAVDIPVVGPPSVTEPPRPAAPA